MLMEALTLPSQSGVSKLEEVYADFDPILRLRKHFLATLRVLRLFGVNTPLMELSAHCSGEASFGLYFW